MKIRKCNDKTLVHNQQPKIEIFNTKNNINKNNRTFLVGPSFSGKTYLMLKNFSRIPDRDIYIITKSTPEQYSISNNEIKETTDEIKPLKEYENGIIVFDDFSGSSDSNYIDQFFIRGRRNKLDIYYLSQSYSDLSKKLYKIIVLK